MTDKGKTLKKKLKSGIVTFIYRKKSTGETRRAVGTTNIALIPKEKRLKPYKERTRRAPSDSIVYYDLDKEDVRSLKDRFLQRVVKTVPKDNALEELYLQYPTVEATKEFYKNWESMVSWMLYDAGVTKYSPADFGIAQP